MNEERDIEALLDRWLADGPTEAPDRILNNLELRVQQQPQPRAWRTRWPVRRSGRGVKPWAAAAAVLALVVVACLLLVRPIGHPVVGTAPSASSPSPSPVGLASPSPGSLPSLRPAQPLASLNVGVSTGDGGLIASDGTTIWVSTDSSIVGIDPTTNTIKTRIPVPQTAYSSAIAATPGALWLTAPDAHPLTLSRYDSRTGALVASVPVPDALWPIAAEGSVWVGEQSGAAVVRINPTTNKVLATVPVGAGGSGGLGDIAAGSGGIWVADPDASTIVEINPATNKVEKTIPVAGILPTSPGSLSVGPSGILAALSTGLTRIDPLTGATSWTTSLDGSIQSTLVQANAIWAGLVPAPPSTGGVLVAIDPGSGVPIDGLSIADGQVSGAFEAFGSVWLVLGQQGLVERFSPDILTVAGTPIPFVSPSGSRP